MPGVTREQIEIAKAVNIENYVLSHEPNNVKRIGRAYYLKDHNSLEISNGLWNWHSQGIGGKNVVDYLVKVRGYSFVDAVRHLAGDEIVPVRTVTPKARAPTVQSPAAEREPFRLPPRNTDNKRVIAYLEKRGISKALTQECIYKGVLYESATWHNAVFVGRDESGKARFAALRGTIGDFKRDADGSDKSYGFCLPPNDRDCKTVIVFESPIDAISHKVLCPEVDGYRLSLGGTALAAIVRFLEYHSEIKNITVCTDNDKAGNSAAKKIAEFPCYRITRDVPPNGAKDWNDALISNKNEVRNLEDKRNDIRFINSDYKTLFTVKDGDSIKFTSGYDGEVKTLKCRHIDETHLTLIGTSHNDYHIFELAEKMERNGSKCEEIPGQKPKLNILAAKYGEALQAVEIPMTDAAIKKLVGGKYTTEEVCGGHVMLRGKEGVVVCENNGGVLTTVHPYWAQTLKRELGTIERPPEKSDFLGKIDKLKDKAAAQESATPKPSKSRDSLD